MRKKRIEVVLMLMFVCDQGPDAKRGQVQRQRLRLRRAEQPIMIGKDSPSLLGDTPEGGAAGGNLFRSCWL